MKNKTNIDIKVRPRHDGGVDLIIAVDGLGLELALSKTQAKALQNDLADTLLGSVRKYIKHLEQATIEVESWPKWKREVIK